MRRLRLPVLGLLTVGAVLAATFGAAPVALAEEPSPSPGGATSPPSGRRTSTATPGPDEQVPAETPAVRGFSTSFEEGQPQPSWTDTVDGAKSSGVRGPDPTGIGGSVMDSVTAVEASDENAEGGEVAANVTDGDRYTKWLTFESTGWLSFTLDAPERVVKYALTSANDAPERDPRDWRLQGSTDGESWATLDERSGEDFAERFETKVYEFDTSTDYRWFRLDVTANHGADIVQLAEVVLSDGSPLPPAGPTMESRADSGPTSAYNARSKTGFTGVRSLRYAGRHTAAGRAWSYNKILDVDVRVTESTSLSYRIFPEFVEGDLRYPSTYAALDLAFTDGTYLSDLRARDQHGNRASPAGQGRSKYLSTNQWNDVRVDVGAVAKGRKVDRILVAYDAPDGPADFRGWIDDVGLGTPKRAATPSRDHPSDWVTTLRGTNSSGSFSRGNNLPATAVPNGFNFWTPVTDAGSTSWLYDYAKGNDASNRPRLQAFGVSHEPSPWMGDRQTFQVMPSSATGVPTADRDARALPFSHAREIAKPHYYGVTFDDGTRVEMAPTDHAAMMRFTFASDTGTLVFDNVNDEGGLTLDEDNGVVTGYSDVKSDLSAGAGRMFVYGVVDEAASASGRLDDGGGANVGGYLRFAKSRQVTLRIATSLIGVDQAKRNLEQEIVADDSFAQVRSRAQRLWDDKLDVIEVEGATPEQQTTLYSNLYRLFLYPNSTFENTGTKSRPVYEYASPVSPKTGEDTPTKTGSKIVRGKMYVNNGFWDTYRTAWPAYSLFAPKLTGELVNGFVQQYTDGGWVSRWSSPGYANLMVGTSSDVAFADAYLKGVPGIDVQEAYDAALKNAAVRPPEASVGRKGLDQGAFLGYTPLSTAEGYSWSMDGYVNDFGIANMSKALYDKAKRSDPRRQEYLDNHRYFLNRARGYVNLYDPTLGFFQGKDDAGVWHRSADAYDPRDWGGDYTETNGWNMAFSAPQDGAGLIGLYGGRAGLERKLDRFFATPETAEHPGEYGGTIHEMLEARDVRLGQYGHSNQPSHHIPYMYDYVRPAKTQALVREAMSRLYAGSEIGQGYPGDEDNGEMSAWWLFSMLGFYPLQVGSPTYAVGSPLFTKATVNLDNGRKLVVNAPGNRAGTPYVAGLRVNGKRWNKTWLPHDALANGGRLDFTMSPRPTSWGTGRNAAPPSITDPGDRPMTSHDSIDDEGAAFTGPGEQAGALHDDDSTTVATLPGDRPTVALGLTKARKVGSYTLTSGASPDAAPSGWALQGSDDGERWTTLDRRSGETFAWGAYTRSFTVARPGSYTHYRLAFTGGGDGVTLAEVELTGTPRYASPGEHPSENTMRTRKKPTERNYG
ncbi:MAG: glycoside hydrolase family 92 protein [Streptosporangiales bacterium]|nr:glycoside hydrolase family 92 protein [Streptosporangiales bacterium]